MILHQGVYLPDGEKHLVDWMSRAGEIVDGKGSYQIKKFRAAMDHCERFRVAVDIGGHVGTWSMQLAKQFTYVHAFEPLLAHRQCFHMNVESPNVRMYAFALGERDGCVNIRSTPTSSGDSWIDGHGDIPMRRLDEFAIHDVDFIKLDCEGYELFALRGGEETIKRDRPTICVEQKPGRAQKYGLPETGAVTYLESLGYELAEVLSGDYILVSQ